MMHESSMSENSYKTAELLIINMPLGYLLIVRFDLFMESIALILAFIIALLAFRAYRVTDVKPFLYLGFGFLLMGIGMLTRVASVSYIL